MVAGVIQSSQLERAQKSALTRWWQVILVAIMIASLLTAFAGAIDANGLQSSLAKGIVVYGCGVSVGGVGIAVVFSLFSHRKVFSG